MPGRLAVDFGTSNTVVVRWDEAQQQGVPLHVPDYGRFYQHGNERVSVIPSLIHYASDRQHWVGNQVLQRNLYKSNRTFYWMKRRIADRHLWNVLSSVLCAYAALPDEEDRRTFFWMNEHSPTFLVADPPAKQGEARFAVEFGIDDNKRLLITARDVQTGRVTHRDDPVIKLT